MANPLLYSSLNLSNHQGETWTKNIRGGVLSSLAPEDPQLKVGETNYFTFTGTPKAELVGEGAAKSSEDANPQEATAKTYLAQVTYRFSRKLLWADEERQMGVIDGLVNNVAIALHRALDLVAIHGINPKTGEVSDLVTDYFNKAGNGVGRVTATADNNADIEAMAEDLQNAGYVATGIAFDPVFAGKLARSRDKNGNKLYPELGLGFGFTNFQGIAAASSDTVSGRQELGIANATVQALMGDFRAFQWGIAEEVPLTTIEYGDPDGKGDLMRLNQLAIRAEIEFGFAIFDHSAFSIVETAAAS